MLYIDGEALAWTRNESLKTIEMSMLLLFDSAA